MKLTKNTWHYKFYKLSYGEDPNHNFCDYFWSLLLALILSPFLFISIGVISIVAIFTKQKELVDVEIKDNQYNHIYKYLSYKERVFFQCEILSFSLKVMFGVAIASFIIAITKIHMVLLSIGVFIGLVLTVFLLFFGIGWISESKFTNNILEVKNIAKEGFLSFKNKYCPKIDWE